MTSLGAASRHDRAVVWSLVLLALLCALAPTIALLLAHPDPPPLPASAAFAGAAALYALLLALIAAVVVRRLATSSAQGRIHDLEEAYRTLESQSRERETLLRETHHRVKNDLQILSSTLRLSDTADLEAGEHEILTDSRNRIHAISLIHELLSSSTSLAGVGIRRYVAELVTNSLKHAFHGVDSGVILVQVERLERGRYLLVVQDNGSGFPKECLRDSEESLGIRLVRALTEQLRGKLDVCGDDGTMWRIEFDAVERDVVALNDVARDARERHRGSCDGGNLALAAGSDRSPHTLEPPFARGD